MRPLLSAVVALATLVSVCTHAAGPKPLGRHEMVLQLGPRGVGGPMAYAPDGRTLATSDDSSVTLWNLRDRSVVRVIREGVHRGVYDLAYSPDGRLLARASGPESVQIWDARTGDLVRTLWSRSNTARSEVPTWRCSMHAVAFSPNGHAIAAAVGASHPMAGEVLVWDVRTGRLLRVLDGHTGAVRSVAFAPDGRTMATVGRDRTVVLWQAVSGRMIRRLEGHNDEVQSVAFSRDGRWLATVSEDGVVLMRDARTGAPARSIRAEGGWRTRIALSPDGASLIVGSDQVVTSWDTRNGQRRFMVVNANSFAVTRDGRCLAYQMPDGRHFLADARTGRRVASLPTALADMVNSIALTSDGRTLAAACTSAGVGGATQGAVQVWNMTTGSLRSRSRFSKWPATSAAFSPDGRTLALGSRHWVDGQQKGLVVLRDWRSDKVIRSLIDHSGPVTSLAFSGDGRILASGGGLMGRSVATWDIGTGSRLATIQDAEALAFSPRGGTLFIGSGDSTDSKAQLRDARTGELLLDMPPGQAPVVAVAFSPDGRIVAGGNWRGYLLVWDAVTGARRLSLRVDRWTIHSVAFSPDSRFVACGGKIVDVRARRIVRTLRPTVCPPSPVAFSADGRTVIGGDAHSRVRVWSARDGRLLVTLMALPGAGEWIALTPDGYYDGSANAGRLLRWRVGQCVRVSAALEMQRRRPDIIREALRGDR